jgi:apolipoprotein N-acyltransferase
MFANLSFIYLLVGGIFQLFNFGKWTLPLAAWLGPLILLRFTRLESSPIAFLLVWLVLFVSLAIVNRGIIPVPIVAYFGVIALISGVGTLPYVVDRLLAPRLPGYLSTLAFPLAWVAIDYLASRVNPYGTWGSAAYTQFDNLPLMQLASVTGIQGINFLIAWFGSTANWAWESHFEWQAVRGGMLIYIGVWCLVMLAGEARLAFANNRAKTVRAAAIGWPEDLMQIGEVMSIFNPRLSEEERQQLRRSFERVQGYFVAETQAQARAGAQVVVWPEANLMVLAADEAAFMQHARQLASEQRIYLLMGMATIRPGEPRPVQNKAVLIDPHGEISFSYNKTRLVPGFEALTTIQGDGHLRTGDTSYGRMTSAICYDMDFPEHIRQAGSVNADLLLVPSSDWEAIKYIHHRMAVYRAIENGVSLLRATRWGISAAVDPLGRTLASMDHFASGQRVMVAQLPMGGMRTIYASIGELFAWLCAAGLLLLSAWASI